VPKALTVCSKPSESFALQWLALALTPRLGPTRARRLVEHFGGVQNIFKASLTELEAAASRRSLPNRSAPANRWN
jgi:predicted Rossmann fold nucleotide-binding protein DprA/Smf involved in DNA uptake